MRKPFPKNVQFVQPYTKAARAAYLGMNLHVAPQGLKFLSSSAIMILTFDSQILEMLIKWFQCIDRLQFPRAQHKL